MSAARAGAGAHPARRTPLQAVATGLGELLLTAGVLVLLFVVWQVWWTDLTSGRVQRQAVEDLQRRWQALPTAPAAPVAAAPAQEPAAPAEEPAAPAQEPAVAADPVTGGRPAEVPAPPAPTAAAAVPEGEAFAILYVPRFGEDYAVPVVEGTDAEDLKGGIGHYEDTAGPGEVGNFALAGHRVTYGKPFHLIAELRDGDPVVVATATEWFTYRVRDRQIVRPSAVHVIAPVPNEPGRQPTQRWLTMTACHPINSARQRYIVHAELESVRPRAEGPPVALGGARD